jgi:hypothetical protein
MLDHKPKLVVMYGSTERKAFGELAGDKLEDWEITRQGSTILTLTRHPMSRPTLSYRRWVEHANALLDWQKNHPAT